MVYREYGASSVGGRKRSLRNGWIHAISSLIQTHFPKCGIARAHQRQGNEEEKYTECRVEELQINHKLRHATLRLGDGLH